MVLAAEMTWSELLCLHFAARSRRVPQARKGPARKSPYMRRARYAPAPRERYLCGAWREFYGCLNPVVAGPMRQTFKSRVPAEPHDTYKPPYYPYPTLPKLTNALE